MWHKHNSTNHNPTLICPPITKVIAHRLMAHSELNTNAMHAHHGQPWWSEDVENEPFGASSNTLHEYIANGTHMLHLTSPEQTQLIFQTFLDTHAKKEGGEACRIVIHATITDAITTNLLEVNKSDHIRGAILVEIHEPIDMYTQDTPWAQGTRTTQNHTCVILIETKDSPPFSTKDIHKDIQGLDIYQSTSKIGITKGTAPWLTGKEDNMVTLRHSTDLDESSILDWHSGDPLSVWESGSELSPPQRGAASMGILPTHLKGALIKAGYDKHRMTSAIMKEISKISFQAGKLSHASHMRGWQQPIKPNPDTTQDKHESTTIHFPLTKSEDQYYNNLRSVNMHLTRQPLDQHSLYRCMSTIITNNPNAHQAYRTICTHK
jgi:hypothetical protein